MAVERRRGCLPGRGALLVAAELEVVFDGLGADCAALAALATLPLAFRRRLPVASFGCVAVLAPTLDRALGSPWGSNANALVFLVLAAAYSVGAHAPLRRSLPALVGAAAWLATLEAIWGDGRGLRVPGAAAGSAVALGSRRTQVPAAGRAVARARVAAGARARGQRARRVARERQRMAHETHDAIAHAVGEMVLQASGAEEVLERDPSVPGRRSPRCSTPAGRPSMSCARSLGILRSDDEPALPLGHDEVRARAVRGAARRGPGRRSLMPGWRSCCWRWASVRARRRCARRTARARRCSSRLLAAAAVVLRGPRPFVALLLAVAAYAGEALLVGGDPGSPATIGALLLTTYSAAARADRRSGIAAACLALGAPAAIALAIAGADAADVLLPVAIFGIPWLVGSRGRRLPAPGRRARACSRSGWRASATPALGSRSSTSARASHASCTTPSRTPSASWSCRRARPSRCSTPSPAQARAALRAIQDVGRDALDHLATLLGLLQPTDDRPPLAPRPGLADLERLLETVRQAGLPVRLSDASASPSRCRLRSTEPRTASSRKR